MSSKQIPIPRRGKGLAEKLRSLTSDGDSFQVSGVHRTGIYTLAERMGVRITIREKSPGTFRIWRVAAKLSNASESDRKDAIETALLLVKGTKIGNAIAAKP